MGHKRVNVITPLLGCDRVELGKIKTGFAKCSAKYLKEATILAHDVTYVIRCIERSVTAERATSGPDLINDNKNSCAIMSRSKKTPIKDMYWFAHGGTESENAILQKNTAQIEDDEALSSNSPTWNISAEHRKASPEESRGLLVTDGSTSSGPSSLERDDRLRTFDKRLAVEERRKQLWEAEQERNDAVLRKHMEREAALEARRNAQRSNISFAFGSSIPRNVETLHTEGKDLDVMSRSFTASGLSQRGDDVMSKSMNASIASAPRGRRKNDLMPTVPYQRTPPARSVTSSSTRKRSVSMTRLDQLALPRKHYVEANKANSSASSGTSSVLKDSIRSPTRPLSSASEHSGGSGRVPGVVNRRVRSSPRKPRPVSIAGTLPDQKQINARPFEIKATPATHHYTPNKKPTEKVEIRKSTPTLKSSTPKSTEKATPRLATAQKSSTPKTTTPKPTTPKLTKQLESKSPSSKSTPVVKTAKTDTSKLKEKKNQPKKKADTNVSSPTPVESKEKIDISDKQNESISSQDNDTASENEKNNSKRVISEEEARAALAEKRRLAREQAEREAELERQRQEQLRLEEEEKLRKEEEEHRKMEEEQLRLLQEHKRVEEEKLRKAIEEQQQKEEEEKAKREEELRVKAEQERKAKEEAEKQRLELEEKLRKEEIERAERKKRLEKIMSRTRGKSSGTSPSGSVSGSEQLDSGENAQESYSSGANSLDSNEAGELPSEQASVEEHLTKAEISSVGDSMEANPTYEIGSENESLNSNELMMPSSETASQDNSLVIIPEKSNKTDESETIIDEASSVTQVSEVESTSAIHVPAGLDTNTSSETEVKSLAFESEDIKLEVVDTVEEKMEISASVVEVESINVESQENSYLDQQVSENKALTSEIMYYEQHPDILEDSSKQATELDTKSGELIMSEDLVEKSDEIVLSDDLVIKSDVIVSSEDLVTKSDELITSEIAVEEETQAQINEFENFESKQSTEVLTQLDEDYNEVSSKVSNKSEAFFDNDNEFLLPEPSSIPSNISFSMDGVDGKGPELLDANRGSSISSDIKLPDPIYETSDDGSISSEKHQQFDRHEDFSYIANQDMAVAEDVFSEQVPSNIELDHQMSDTFVSEAFADNQKAFSTDDSEYVTQNVVLNDSQFKNNYEEIENYNMSESMYQDKLLDALEQPREIGEENVIPSLSSTSNVIETNLHLSESEFLKKNDVFNQDNKENLTSEITAFNSTEVVNQDDMSTSAYDIYSNKENLITTSETGKEFETLVREDLEPIKDNPFVGNPFSGSESNMFQSQSSDNNLDQQHSYDAAEQIDYVESQTINNSELSTKVESVSDVTFIKSDDNGAYIGIISSIDHDHSSNDFLKSNLQDEQLKNNFEFASMTDSEENSSLDSNLSQIMTVEHSDKVTIGGLNHIENSITETNSSQQVYSNGVQHNPFETEPDNNYSTTNSFPASEISNGHRIESSNPVAELHGFGQLDGNNILSVDHSKNNIFENVDAIDYGKVSPDPFLGKGNSKQISGNPFLLQDDQKQVLMTPDFLN
ncbi:reticulocyte-binding protein 2-like protein a [Caerostris darwini]|uniref:Reticulocyte-binding protein 2-like protein a n=1 Tax=Caerostris darwini TaxID=1538125 RepID=A0AAV4R5H6_9ARAC|nr:reticulocyte-binding protein 2-like protein a [Caerostris darwini]